MSTSKLPSGRRSVAPFILVLLMAALAAVNLCCSVQSRPNVLWITVDSLRPDHLGCYGYERAHTPNIDALAHDGALFREAIAQGTYTRISVPSMITGKYSFFTGVRTHWGHLDSTHTTLAEVLSDNGYATLATNRMWSQSFYQGFAESGPPDRQTPWRTERAIQGLRDHQNNPFFIWLYYWDPHAPYEPPEEFMRFFQPDYREESAQEREAKFRSGDLLDATGNYNGSIKTLNLLSSGEVRLTPQGYQHILDLYDAEIAFVDAEIGKLMAELKRMGLYDNTLIVLNADHGEGFGEHDAWYHGTTVFDEMARVPLIIKLPDAEKTQKEIRGPVRNIDIMPTVLDYCSLPVPDECNGQSLRRCIDNRNTPSLPAIIETHLGKRAHLVALRAGGYKLIYDLANDSTWLYDLTSDPAEGENLLPNATIGEMTSVSTLSPAGQQELKMRRELLDLLAVSSLADLPISQEDLRPVDRQTTERLKALGYVY